MKSIDSSASISSVALICLLFVPFAAGPLAAQIAPTITRQPMSLSRSLGDTATFNVDATGDAPLSYQWQHGDLALANATNRTLRLTNLLADAAGAYRVVVANAVGQVTSEPASLDVDGTFTRITDSPIVRDSAVGMSWGDYDNDGFIDLYCGGRSQNLLYHNTGDGTFTKLGPTNAIAARSYATDNVFAAVWADYDNDGWLDLFVPTGWSWIAERNQLFHNLGNGQFALVNTPPIGTEVGASMSAAWGDFNRDGRLDLFLANFPLGGTGDAQNYLYFAKADATFVRATADQFPSDRARSYAGSAADYNNDGLIDIAVGTNPGGQIVLYENNGAAGFERFITGGGGSFIGGGAWSDADNDGDLDLFVTYGRGACKLFQNDGIGNLEQVSDGDLPSEPGRASGAAWGDYDNDGWLDLFVPRIAFYAKDDDQNDSLWRNNGNGTFTRMPAGSIGNDGVESNGAAWGDYDNDGFLDLAIGCLSYSGGNEKSLLYRNNGNANNWITFKLVGTRSNRSATGAKVRVSAKIEGQALTQFREIGTGNAWGQNDPRAHFGLGDATVADKVRIEWPSGQVQELTNVLAKQFLAITEPDGSPRLKAERVVSGFRLTLTGDANATYELQSAPDLTNWQPVTNVTTTAIGTVTHDTSFDQPQRFYRAVKR